MPTDPWHLHESMYITSMMASNLSRAVGRATPRREQSTLLRSMHSSSLTSTVATVASGNAYIPPYLHPRYLCSSHVQNVAGIYTAERYPCLSQQRATGEWQRQRNGKYICGWHPCGAAC